MMLSLIWGEGVLPRFFFSFFHPFFWAAAFVRLNGIRVLAQQWCRGIEFERVMGDRIYWHGSGGSSADGNFVQCYEYTQSVVLIVGQKWVKVIRGR